MSDDDRRRPEWFEGTDEISAEDAKLANRIIAIFSSLLLAGIAGIIYSIWS